MLRSLRPHHSLTVAAAVTALVIAGCGGSAAETGQTVIEEKLAEDIGLGDLDAECNEPDDLAEGETFTCSATTEDGQTIEFLGTMTSDDEFEIVTTNLLTAEDLVPILDAGAQALSGEVNQRIVASDIDCGDGVVLVDEVGDFLCEITDATSGRTFELIVQTGGLLPRIDPEKLFFLVGEPTN